MNSPTKFYQFERALDPFVNAAQTTALASACDVLYIHGSDLTWGESKQDFFLVDMNVDEDVEEIAQVVGARAKMGFSRVLKMGLDAFLPFMMGMLPDVVAKQGQQSGVDEKEAIGAAIAAKLSNTAIMAELEKRFSSFVSVGQLPLLSDAIASWLIRDAHKLRQRQMAAYGMTDDDYRDMLYALRRFNLCERIVRVAYPEEGFQSELSLSSRGGFGLTDARDGARLVEVFRLAPALSALKRGREDALAVFIADYVNTQFSGPPQAFACAQYGGPDAPEFDVVIPVLGVGFEIKLYQSPFSQTRNKLENNAGQLKKQIPAYAGIGCAQLYYVSNLEQEMAESVSRMVQDACGPGVEMHAIGGGIHALLPVLDGLVGLLEQVREAQLSHEFQLRMAASKKSGGTSKGGKQSGRRKAAKKRTVKSPLQT
jgi:hypothetical protein